MTGKTGYISLLHLSWGHPRRALPVILALWSPDFPHPGPVGDPAATVRPGRGNIVPYEGQIVKYLAKTFIREYTIIKGPWYMNATQTLKTEQRPYGSCYKNPKIVR